MGMAILFISQVISYRKLKQTDLIIIIIMIIQDYIVGSTFNKPPVAVILFVSDNNCVQTIKIVSYLLFPTKSSCP